MVPTLDEIGVEHSHSDFVRNGTKGTWFYNMYWVYILRSKSNNKFYVGCTDNIIRRVKEHNLGLSKYTKGKGPWVIIYPDEFKSLSDARKREKQIKSWKKRIAIERLIQAAVV